MYCFDFYCSQNLPYILALVSISFDNYRTIHPGILESDSTSSDEDDEYDENEDDKAKQPGNSTAVSTF